MMQISTVNAAAIQKSSLIEAFLILCCILYARNNQKTKEKKVIRRRLKVTDRLKIGNIVFRNSGFSGVYMTFVK